MKHTCVLVLLLSISYQTQAQFSLYEQPLDFTGVLRHSSRMEPDGSDWDGYVWDNFTLNSAQPITEINWTGGFDPGKFGSGGPVFDFTVGIYASIPAGTQPDVVNPPLVKYLTGGNANQVVAGVFGGATLYDYSFTLPTAFSGEAGAKYWLQIEAHQNGIPDWGVAAGAGGDNGHYRRVYSMGDLEFQSSLGDTAFSLVSPVPEPASASLALGLGLAAFALWRGLRRKASGG